MPTEVTDVTTFLAALKGVMGEGRGMDGRRPCHVARKESEGDEGGVVEGLGLDEGLVLAAWRAGDAGGVLAGVLETELLELRPKKNDVRGDVGGAIGAVSSEEGRR